MCVLKHLQSDNVSVTPISFSEGPRHKLYGSANRFFSAFIKGSIDRCFNLCRLASNTLKSADTYPLSKSVNFTKLLWYVAALKKS